MTQYTQLKMTSELWGCRVRHMSRTIWNWAIPSHLLKHSIHCFVTVVTRGVYKQCSYLTDVARSVVPEIIYSVAVAPTAPTYQPNNQWKTTALISLRLTLYCSPFMDFCASQVAVTQLLLMQLILMPMSRQPSFRNRYPVCFVSRERRAWFLVKTWWLTRWQIALYSCTVWQVVMQTRALKVKVRCPCRLRCRRAI